MSSRSKKRSKPKAAALLRSAPAPRAFPWPAPLAGMAPDQRNLSLAVAVSLLVHAVVLSIHFHVPQAIARAADQALEVVLVNSKHAQKPKHAQARAQANLDGGGNTDQERMATTPLPPTHDTRDGNDLVQAAQRRVAQLEAEQRRLMSRLKSHRAVASQTKAQTPQAEPMPAEPSGLDLASRALATASLEAQIERQYDEYNKRPRRKFVGARTEAYVAAQYIEDWRQKIERLGNLNYPAEAKGKLYGSLTLYVEINSDGELVTAKVERSSGQKVLDQAALRIVRMAAPFGRFSGELKQQMDILAFARVWSFTQADMLTSSAAR